jgi:uncharacterized protein (DUF488 family)
MAPLIAGIGYERAALADLLATLQAAGIGTIVDVRERPQSRRAGFSKSMLAASAERCGIAYRHMKALGTPPEGRQAHRQGEQERFWRIVAAQLATEEAGAAIAALDRLARSEPVCLLCYEADWRHCHRKLIMELMAARGFCLNHLAPLPFGAVGVT